MTVGDVQLFEVPGISCDHCKRTVEEEVGGLSGVTHVYVDVAAKTVTVEGEATTEAVRAAIAEAGYEVTP
jgi:copper chaperone